MSGLCRGTIPRICARVDVNAVYRIDAVVGQTLTVLLDGSGGDADLYVYAPGTQDVNTDPWAARANTIGNEEMNRGVVQVEERWYIDVYAYHTAGQPPRVTDYVLTVTLTDATGAAQRELGAAAGHGVSDGGMVRGAK